MRSAFAPYDCPKPCFDKLSKGEGNGGAGQA